MNKFSAFFLNATSSIYFYFKLGWGAYISLVLSATAYLTILYNYILAKFFPTPNLYLYLGAFALIVIASFVVGYVAQRSKFWSKEHLIGSMSNPAINVPLGDKDILGYDSSILSFEASLLGYRTTIISLKNQMEVNRKLGIDTKTLEETLFFQEEMMKRMEGMMHRFKDMRSKAVEVK